MTAGQGRPDFEARLHSDVRSTNLSYQTICLTYGILLSTSEEQVSGVDAVNRLASAHREYSPTSASPLQTPPDLAPPCRSPAACVFLASARSTVHMSARALRNRSGFPAAPILRLARIGACQTVFADLFWMLPSSLRFASFFTVFLNFFLELFSNPLHLWSGPSFTQPRSHHLVVLA